MLVFGWAPLGASVLLLANAAAGIEECGVSVRVLWTVPLRVPFKVPSRFCKFIRIFFVRIAFNGSFNAL